MRVVTLGRLLGGLFALFGGAAALTVADVPAFAQFGSIFGDPPPRPPARIPGGENRDDRYPQIYREEPPQSRQYPGPYEPQQQPGGRVQQQPLPPVPLDTRTPPPQQAQPGQPPAQPGQAQTAQPPRQRGTPQPSNTAPQPGDEVIAEPPSQKIPNASAVFSGLDKITGRIIKFDVAINETVQFGALQVVPRVCYTRPPTESQNTNSFVEVSEVTLQGEIRRIFTGWMFASSPGLHAVEHPIYDIWLSDCKDPQVKVAEEPAPAPAPVAAPVPQQRPAQRPQQRAQQPQGTTAQQPAPPPPPPSAQQQRVAPPPFFR